MEQTGLRLDHQRVMLHFPQSVEQSYRNPLFFCTSISDNTSHNLQMTVTSARAHRWTFDSYLQVERPISLNVQKAGWRQFSVADGGASLNFFVRWYCEHEFYGVNCDRHCNEFECGIGILYNQTDYLAPHVIHSEHYIPELFDPVCLKAPCVVFNIPKKAMVYEDVLRIAVDSFLIQRFLDAPYMDTQSSLKIANLLNSTFEIDEVKLADGRQMVTVSVGATLAGVPIAPISMRHILLEVSNASLLPLCIVKAQHETIPYSKSPAHRTTDDPNHHWLIVGFWIVLAMAVVLSCIIGVLIRKRQTAKRSELCQCQRLIADDQRSIHSIYRTDRQ
ncbi:hypothetical protein PHET_04534 [Paragonimus heterotremus]|uniref:Uncharacterized protein n=1 Tax=Paragonimus heterotremus TaxID=100268 RepID=A0A8J4TGD9_9TREM|nr:hypothetical protein PHET_04534 [Paragonimus heterotremus]